MAEEDTLKKVDEALDILKDSSPRSREYCKFIISLGTGTLVFSVTFLKEFGSFPEYNFILVIGWLCLLVSIIAGVLLLPKTDQLQVTIQNLKNVFRSPREELVAALKKELQQHYLKTWIKGMIDGIFKDDAKKKEELYQFTDNLPAEGLKKFFEKISILGVGDSKDTRPLKEFIEEIYKFLSLTKKTEQATNPILIFRNLRKIFLGTIWFSRIMIYGFFVGIFAISLFSIINILE
jgi:hypothetical protein